MKKLHYFIILLMLSACSLTDGNQGKKQVQNVVCGPREDVLVRVLQEEELKVAVDYNSISYFVYKGQPMGFQYELLKAFAEDMGVELKLIVSNDIEETFNGLENAKYDLVAQNLTVTKERNELVDFTTPLDLTRQVLVQRKPDGADTLTEKTLNGLLIREQFNLANKTVYVQKNTVFAQRLENLSDEIGEPIIIIEDSIYGVEQLIALVASGEIDYTVCDENVAKVNQHYFPCIDVNTPVSFKQKLSWAVQKNTPEWKAYLDNWIVNFKKTDKYKYLHYKYFSGKASSQIVHSEYHSITGGKISEFDDLIRQISSGQDWDWRLVASIIMQESRFNKDIESWVGAVGLMQLMPQTAELFGVEDLSDPRENIRGGIAYLSWLNQTFKPIIPNSDERLKFVLASYNVGIGHVMDARKLAMKYGKDSSVWKDNVEIFMRKKSLQKFYTDPVVKWGYCRGQEPCKYVNAVLNRYQHYLNLLPDENNIALVSFPVLQSSWR